MPWWGWRMVHFGLATLASLFAIIGIALAEWAVGFYGGEYYFYDQVGVAVVFGWAGAVLIRYPKARYFARLLLICAVVDGCGMLAGGIALATVETGPMISVLSVVESLGVFGTLPMALAWLPQVFPDGPMRNRPWPAVFRVTVALAIAVSLFFVIVQQVFGGYDTVSEVAFWCFIAYVVAGIVVGTVSLLVRWRTAPTAIRPQIRLYAALNVAAPILIVGTSVSSFVVPNPSADLFLILWPIAVVVVIAITVVRTQLYDIRIVVRRAAVYAVLALLVGLLFVGVYFLVLFLISENLDRSEYRWVALAIAAAAVVLLEPLRRRLRDRLEQRLLGDRGDPLRALDRLELGMAGRGDEAVYTGIAEAVATAVRSPGVGLWVHRDGSSEQLGAYGTPAADCDVVPLVQAGERIGELRVARRTPGEEFHDADTRLLRRMAHEAAGVVYVQRRDSELAGARRQAVDAVMEERSRLGRDLHDELAPLLAGASLGLEALRRGIPTGSPEELEAARLAALLRASATNTRRLAYDLQPPAALADLTGALEHHLESLSGPNLPSFELHVDIGDVPQSVRHAAYRVVLEAVNNVVHHARAERAAVSLIVVGDVLRLEVVDDGVGVAQPYTSGIGISSMRRRVESIGGTFAVNRGRPRGTVVSARIPLELHD